MQVLLQLSAAADIPGISSVLLEILALTQMNMRIVNEQSLILWGLSISPFGPRSALHCLLGLPLL